MRFLLMMAVLAGLWFTAAPGLFEQGGPNEEGSSRPVPQDLEKMNAQYRERLKEHQETYRGAYEKVGTRDARWNEPARKALDLAAELFSNGPEAKVSLDDVYKPAKEAVEAGCDDPMILYLYARCPAGSSFPGEEEYRKRMNRAAKALENSEYSASMKASGLARSALSLSSNGATEEDRKEAQRELDALLDLVTKGAATDKEKPSWDSQWYWVSLVAIEVGKQLGLDDPAAYEKVDAALAKVEGREALRKAVRGRFFYDWGWEARGQRFAAFVGRDQFRSFDDRLTEAKKSLVEAWKIRPGFPRIAALMVDVDKSNGGNREEMEMWFERAMESDADDFNACLSKLDWLDPKWHGDGYGDMVAFGKACAATKNAKTGITLLVAEAHWRVAASTSSTKARAEYLGRKDVWPEIEHVYEEYLQFHPENHMERSKYAVLCAYANRLFKSHQQFEILGDNMTTWTTFPFPPMSAMRQIRAAVAQAVGAKAPAP